jgi:HAD superfamily phosphatase (TIGR01668 family)
MGFSLIPGYSVNKNTDISPTLLINAGIKFLMIDIDNTICSYDEKMPAEEIHAWISGLKENGITPGLVSNSSRLMRVHEFAEAFDIRSVAKAGKPSTHNMRHLIESSGFSLNESAMVGDQIITDVLAANRLGILSIIVKPKKLKNIFFLIRYILEQPFRYFSDKNVNTLMF